MSKQIDILESLNEIKKLKKLSFDKLYELEGQYPFSSMIDVLINRKQFKVNGNLSLSQMVNFVNKIDNPGLAFSAVVEGVGSSKESVKKEKKKTSKVVKKKKNQDAKDVGNRLNKSGEGKLVKGIASEQLAEVYLKQGMKKDAIEMYKALSLQNPKKSAYFAKILKKIKK